MHDHDHDHDGGHGLQPAHDRRGRLFFVLCLAAVYMAAEAIGGWLSNSLALLADAGHMLSDVAALGLSLFAVWIASQQPATSQRTFGYHRAEILAALANGTLLLAVSGGILLEAWHRWAEPPAVDTTTMLVIAIGGLIVNGVMLSALHGGHQHDLSVRGAWLHVLGDTLGSVGVIVAALGLRWWNLAWIDPLASGLISVLIVASAVNLMKEAVDILMEKAPESVEVAEVRRCLLTLPGVRGVHCLHVWRIASGRDSMSAHIVVDQDRWNADQLQRARTALQERFAVGHITLQMEPDGFHGCSDEAQEHCDSQPPGAE